MKDVKARVFLVEDEDLVSMLTEGMLSDLGYEVAASAANLESGMAIAAQDSFEVAVLDINLHGKQSYPIAEILRDRRIPFVFVSGYAGKGIAPEFAGVSALQKPFSSEALGQTLRHALNQ